MSSYRADKYLWAVRLFKKRSDAADGCRSNRVIINGVAAKPSRDVKVGDIIEMRRGRVNYRYEVKAFPKSRVSAKLVEDFLIDHTPEEELEKLNVPKESIFLYRERGSGRPTKKERRDLDNLINF